MSTVKKKAVSVVRLTVKPAKGDQKPEFKDIQPGVVFDCPKDLVKELTDAGAITAPGKVTPQEATEAAPKPEVQDKDALIARAKELGVKGVNKTWAEDTLAAAIAEAEDAADETGDDDGTGEDDNNGEDGSGEGDDDAEDVM